MRKYFCAALLLAGAIQAYGADELDPKKVRRIPPAGVALSVEARTVLEDDLKGLEKEIEKLKDVLKDKPELLALLPDVQIFYKAVHDAVKYDEFFNEKSPADAGKRLLAQGWERAKQLRAGAPAWTTATGAVVRGYVSKIDGSVQPYGLVVPATFDPKDGKARRLDLWYHGRGEDLSELKFIEGRSKSLGEFAPKDAFVLHPYGRYCNANKFAGEVDTFEALDAVKRHYKIDENRISVRGFSMGGASTWQFATHFPGLWAAAAPGAGFAETPEFTHAFDPKNTPPTDYEQKLWHLYDSTHYAENLFNLPTVAYSGELDGQKQAADIMTKALKAVGLELKHVIGPGVKHQYEPKAKIEVARLVDELAEKGRNPVPKHIKFVTYTLRYNQAFWITLESLGEHWKKARIDAEIEGDAIKVTTENINKLTFHFEPGHAPFAAGMKPKVNIDGIEIELRPVPADHSLMAHLSAGFKAPGERVWMDDDNMAHEGSRRVKSHGLQGPIDDAFMDSFVMVTPSGAPFNAKTGEWFKTEMAHAIEHWRRQFRGEARVVADKDLSEAQIQSSNLILWGDPSSNAVLAKIAGKLPLKWNANEMELAGKTYPAADHVAILIYPNPLNPKKYVVLNSGFTFRENEYLNNAKQNAKLPDWALVDITNGANSKWPGKVDAAGFFDEQWQGK